MQYLTKTGSGSNTSTTAQNTTIYNASNVPSGAKRVTITGGLNAQSDQYYCYLNVNGSNFVASTLTNENITITTGTTQIQTRFGNSGRVDYGSFKIDIDLNAGSYVINISANTRYNGAGIVIGRGTISSVVASLRGNGSSASSASYTITYTY